ncbi:MAG: TonB-dependent receptor, partial [Bacteroidales bacterium]|nr:TonB-dependent receptor [Bacteroidales bacterium]
MKKNICVLVIIFSFSVSGFSQKQTDANINGNVINKISKEHIPYIHVSIKGTTLGTVVDATGHYFLKNLPTGKHTIIASGVGYKTIEQEINLVAGKTIEVNFEMEEDLIMLESVVVSANRNETNRKEAPVIVNIISPILFENTNSVCLAEGLSFQPGLRLETNCQNCGDQKVRINGLEGQYSQILINNRPIYSALNAVYGLEQIPTNMIERVEVVRGGGSALFGANAIGGTINIITKEPLSNTFQIGNNLAYLNGEVPDNTLTMNGSILTDDYKSGIFLFGSFRNRQPFDANSDGFSEIGKNKNNSFGFKSYFKPTAYSKITLEYHNIYEFRRGGNDFGSLPHQADITEQTGHFINGGGLDYILLSKNYKSNLSVFASAQHIARDSYYSSKQDANAYGTTKDISAISGIQFSNDFDKIIFTPATFTTGIEYQINEMHDQMPAYKRDFKQNINNLGFFAQNEWKTEKLGFLLGARLDKHNLIEKPIISPRTNLLYSFTDDIQMRLTYATGFRAPQAFDEDLHICGVGGEAKFVRLADNLKPETSYSFSGSFDMYHHFGKVQSNLLIEVFYTRLIDVFVLEEVLESVPDTLGVIEFERRNGSGAEVYGINLESKIACSEYFQIQFGLTFQKSKYLEPEQWSDDITVASLSRIPRAPDSYGYFTATLSSFKSFTASLTSVYTGKMLVPHFAGYVSNDTSIESSPFFELNIKLIQNFLISDQFNCQINGGVQNILNSYQEDFDKYAYRDPGYVYGPSRPRTFF